MNRRRMALLSNTFFGRLFEHDLFSSPASASSAVTWLLAALATPGVMFSASQYYFYAHARTFTPDVQDRILFVSQAFHVDFAMAIAGIVTMMVWTSLAPDRRDALVLGPLPIGPREQALARLITLLRFFALFVAALALPTAVAFTFVTVGDAPLFAVLMRVIGHVVGVSLGAAFVFFVLADIHLVLAAVIGPRAVAVATWPLQAAAILAMLAAVAMTGRLADALVSARAAESAAVMWNPAAWFVAAYRWIAGDARELFATLAARGTAAVLVAVAGAALVYPLAYRRCLEHVVASEGRRAARWSGALTRLWLRCLAPFLRTPLERGLAAFIVATFMRTQTHRFLIGSYVAVGVLFALPLSGRLLLPANSAAVQFAWLSVPLGLLWWSAAALRVAMMLPVEPAANWIFKLTEPVDKTCMLSTAVVVIHAATTIPIAVAFGMAASVAAGVPFGAAVCALVATTGLALVEVLTLTLRTVPATCTYRPGQLRLRVLWPLYLLLWTTVAYVLPRLAVTAVAGGAGPTVALLGALALTALLLRTWRTMRARKLARLVFEEVEAPLTTTIDVGWVRH